MVRLRAGALWRPDVLAPLTYPSHMNRNGDVTRFHATTSAELLTLRINGDLDLTATSTTNLDLLIPPGTPVRVALDLAGVDFIDSAGISFLLSLQRRCAQLGANLHVTNVRSQVMRTLGLVGLVSHLNASEIAE